MPFLMPIFGDGDGTRDGVTDLTGSLTPIVDASGAFLSAAIGAHVPTGTILTWVTAGVPLGVPPFGTSMLAVSVTGVGVHNYQVASLGGYALVHSDVTITIEEEAILDRPKRRRPSPKLYRSPESEIFPDKWTAGIGWQFTLTTSKVVSCNLEIPVRPRRNYICFVTLTTFATCEGVTGF